MDNYEIEKEFKSEFGMMISDAAALIKTRQKESEELFYLNCLVGGFDISTGEKSDLTSERKELAAKRIDELRP